MLSGEELTAIRGRGAAWITEGQLVALLDALDAARERERRLVKVAQRFVDLSDADPCRYDSLGCCWLHYDENPCSVAQARDLLTETEAHGE